MTKHVEVMDLVARMKAAEEAFVLATVVRTVSVTAAKAGAKAIIRPDGSIVAGWIGGGCARGAVLKAAREALADGEPRMVSVQPENLLAELGVKPGENRDGVRFAENMCPSKGTMDVFVEPVLPHPALVILGASPVALSLADAGAPARLSRHGRSPRGRRQPPAPTPTRWSTAMRWPAARGQALRRGLDPGQGRRGRAARRGRDRGRLSRLRRQPPQDGGAARKTDRAKASTRQRSTASRRRPASTLAPSRRRKSRCRSWRRSRWSGEGGSGGRGSNHRHCEERQRRSIHASFSARDVMGLSLSSGTSEGVAGDDTGSEGASS